MATTTPIYGFDVPTSTDYVKDGATAIETLGDDVDAMLGVALNNKLHAGLVLIKTQSITSGSVATITSVFSTTYDAYKIVISGLTTSGSVGVGCRLNTVATDYYQTLISAGAYNTSGTLNYTGVSAGTSWDAGIVTSSGVTSGGTIEIQNPFAASATTMQSSGSDTRTTGVGLRTATGYHSLATSYTDFTLLVSGQTFSAGRITVYGYAKD
jgi:hypothetical protein